MTTCTCDTDILSSFYSILTDIYNFSHFAITEHAAVNLYISASEIPTHGTAPQACRLNPDSVFPSRPTRTGQFYTEHTAALLMPLTTPSAGYGPSCHPAKLRMTRATCMSLKSSNTRCCVSCSGHLRSFVGEVGIHILWLLSHCLLCILK